MKIVGGIVIGLVLASAFFLSRPTPVPEKTQKEFQSLNLNEARAFAEAKTPEDKLKAAEALYGKMMILFLANLGLELRKSTPVELSETNKELPLEETPAVESASVPVLTCPPCAQINSTERKEEIKQSVPERFGATPYFSKMTPELKKINGTFEGKLHFISGQKKGRSDQALFIVDLQQTGPSRTLKGEVRVMLTDDTGKTYSRNVGKGGNKSIRFNARENMVYVEASPVSFFAIRASEFNRDIIRGEYYDHDKLVGRAALLRQ